MTFAQGFFDEDVDHITIFSMDKGEQVVPASDAHSLKNVAVADAQTTVVGSKDLDGRNSVFG